MPIDRRATLVALAGLPFAGSLSAALPPEGGRLDPDRVGVNTHLAQGERPERVAAALDRLRVRHIRDSVPGGPPALARFLQVLRGPVRLTANVGPHRPVPESVAALEALERARPGVLAGIEGPNEVNNFPMDHKGEGTAAADAFQDELYRAVRASAVIGRVPVLNYTGGTVGARSADFMNFHPYPEHGAPLTQRLAAIRGRAGASATPGKPIQFTEFGYSTAEVTEGQQAALIVGGLREALGAGVRRVFIYQLSDFYRDHDPAAPRPANHYGLFDLDYRPKQAADAVARLLA